MIGPARAARSSPGCAPGDRADVHARHGDVYVEADGWTVATSDDILAAHFEHTIAITADGPEILTRSREGRIGAASRQRRPRCRGPWTDPRVDRAAALRPRDVLQSIVEEAAPLCRADSADIAIRDGEVFRMTAFTGFSPEFEQLVRGFVYQPGPGGRCDGAPGRRVVHIEDMLADPDSRAGGGTEIQRVGGIGPTLACRSGTAPVIGVIGAARNEVRPFAEREIGLVQHFADQVAIAIELARLLETIERQRTELARMRPRRPSSCRPRGRAVAGRPSPRDHRDLRRHAGVHRFAETAEPEEVLGVLREYHAAVGELVVANGGTVEHFAGDGLMVFFNDPTPIDDHQLAAVRGVRCASGSPPCRRLAEARLRARPRHRDRDRLRDPRPDRLRRPLRLRRRGHARHPRLAPDVRGQAGQILISQRVIAVVEEAVETDEVLDLSSRDSAARPLRTRCARSSIGRHRDSTARRRGVATD